MTYTFIARRCADPPVAASSPWILRSQAVPLAHYRMNAAVSAIMVEVRRNLYQEEPGGQVTAGWQDVAVRLGKLIAGCIR
ncbi:MAG: hypothetical protein NVS3B21_18510 [Acidimicrobiales bacterium]